MSLSYLTPRRPPSRSIHHGRIVAVQPADGTVTFTLDGSGDKAYGPAAYQAPPADELRGDPPAGTPIVALFWGPGLTDVFVVPIGWPP